MVPRSLSLSLSLSHFSPLSSSLPFIHPSMPVCSTHTRRSPLARSHVENTSRAISEEDFENWNVSQFQVRTSLTHSLTHSPLRISRSLMRKDGSRDCAWKCISVCAGHPLYRVVQLNSTPEIKVSYMLFERPLSIFTMTLVCKRNSIFLFRPNTNIRLAENPNIRPNT